MLRELAVEQFSFSCGHCHHSWVTEYDVQHVEDGRGHGCEYYTLNGLPVIAPTKEGGLCCPQCGAMRLWVRMRARRPIPLVSHDAGHPGHPVDPREHAAKRDAPLLRGDRPEPGHVPT